MAFWELLLLAVSLSMDAFAVALCKGLCMKSFNKAQALLIAGLFGLAQGIMPLAGWLIGQTFAGQIEQFDHWIAFLLLAFIGGKMLFEALKGKDECESCDTAFQFKQVLLMALATSVDALAVGVTFAFLQVSVLPAAGLITLVTFWLALIGVYIGFRFGSRFKKKAELAGGIALILIGLKILLEHLGFWPF